MVPRHDLYRPSTQLPCRWQWPDVGAGWRVEPHVLVVFGHGETETVPAGALERGPPGVGVLDGAPYASGAGFGDVVPAVHGGESDLGPGAVPHRDRGGGGGGSPGTAHLGTRARGTGPTRDRPQPRASLGAAWPGRHGRHARAARAPRRRHPASARRLPAPTGQQHRRDHRQPGRSGGARVHWRCRRAGRAATATHHATLG
jgi:hypothetical protein